MLASRVFPDPTNFGPAAFVLIGMRTLTAFCLLLLLSAAPVAAQGIVLERIRPLPPTPPRHGPYPIQLREHRVRLSIDEQVATTRPSGAGVAPPRCRGLPWTRRPDRASSTTSSAEISTRCGQLPVTFPRPHACSTIILLRARTMRRPILRAARPTTISFGESIRATTVRSTRTARSRQSRATLPWHSRERAPRTSVESFQD